MTDYIMKLNFENFILKFAAVAVLASVILAGCDRDRLKMKIVEFKRCEALAEGRADSVIVNVSLEYPVAGIPDEAVNSIKGSICREAFRADGSIDIEASADSWADSCVREYRDANLELLSYLGEQGDDSACLSWEMSVSGFVCGEYKGMISYDVTSYSYTGGAHGSTSETGMVFDVSGNLLTETDLFGDGYRETLSGLLSSRLEESLPDPDAYNALFIKDIEPNGNFIVTQEGVTYIYGQYEIGPYYLGIIKVTLPWEDMEGILKR